MPSKPQPSSRSAHKKGAKKRRSARSEKSEVPSRFEAKADDAGLRPDRAIRRYFPKLDRNGALKLLKTQKIVVNGATARLSTLLKEGDLVVIRESKLGAAFAPGVSLIFNEGGVFVAHKPAGVAMHEGSGVHENMRSSMLSLIEGAECPPRFLGRLDRPTSGFVLGAVSDEGDKAIRRHWESGAIHKSYLSLVHGRCDDEGTIDIPLASRKEKHRGKGRSDEARTHFRTLFSCRDLSLLELKLDTGRTHQIRRHVKAIRHPMLGDERYGDARLDRKLEKKSELALEGLYLHCLGYSHSGEVPILPRSLKGTLPAKMSPLLECFGADVAALKARIGAVANR